MRKGLKIAGFFFTLGVLFFTFYMTLKNYVVNQYWGANEHYPHFVGYLNPENTLSNEDFELCNGGKIDFQSKHHGGVDYAYKGEKRQFKQIILKEYQNKNYSDSGYIAFRFIVNCKAQVGRIEVIELDLNLQKTSLNPEMVQKLLTLTSDSKHWNIHTVNETPVNYYMYVLYRIENGNLVEILP